MQEACPHCGERISLRRAWGARCTECPHCCSTLCSETPASQRSGSLTTAKSSPAEIAKSRLVADFVEATQRLGPDEFPRAPDVRRLIESAIRRGIFDTRSALALEARISKGTLDLYEHQGGNASLDCLARLALAADVSLAGLFMPNQWSEGVAGGSAGNCSGLKARRSRPRRDWSAIEASAESSLVSDAPMTTAEFARVLGTCPVYLRKRLGDKAAQMDEAVRSRAEQLRLDAASRLAQVIVEKAGDFVARGVRVSARRLAASVKARRNSRRFRTALDFARERAAASGTSTIIPNPRGTASGAPEPSPCAR